MKTEIDEDTSTGDVLDVLALPGLQEKVRFLRQEVEMPRDPEHDMFRMYQRLFPQNS